MPKKFYKNSSSSHNMSRPAIPFGSILGIAHLKRRFVSPFRSLEGIQPLTIHRRKRIMLLTVQPWPSPYPSSKFYPLAPQSFIFKQLTFSKIYSKNIQKKNVKRASSTLRLALHTLKEGGIKL